MNLLYIDIDSLRADHLGCYGYARPTSPNIDALAATGWRFDNCYVSDAPCQPSRTAFATGRFGFQSGVVAHGGRRAEPYNTSAERIQAPDPRTRHWFHALERAGWRTASISSFASRHAAWWYLAGLRDWHSSGKDGMERADEVTDVAIDWLKQHGTRAPWVLHVNLWDPHTPYRAPVSAALTRGGAPLWIDAERLANQRASFGPLSAQDGMAYWFPGQLPFERPGIPSEMRTLDDVARWFDGYDDGVRFADEQVGRLLAQLRALGLDAKTLVVVSADHGENLGENNLYGDHQTVDHATTRVPFIVHHPTLTPARVHFALHYQFDLAASLLGILGVEVPAAWDARSAWPSLQRGVDQGRDHLVVSQMAWSCQRGVRWGEWLLIRTYHPGLKALPPLALHHIPSDPHQLRNRAQELPEVTEHGLALLEGWTAEQRAAHPHGADPMAEVIAEGGPSLARGHEERYAERLRATGRAGLIGAMRASAHAFD